MKPTKTRSGPASLQPLSNAVPAPFSQEIRLAGEGKPYARRIVATIGTASNRIQRQSRHRKQVRTKASTMPGYEFGWNTFTLSAISPFVALIFWFYIFLDKDVARQVREVSPTIRYYFGEYTEYGKTTWMLTIFASLLIVLSLADWSRFAPRARIWFASVFTDLLILFYCAAASGILASLLKNSIGRARPKMVNLLGPHYFDFFAFKADYASFPSGHSTTFGAVCMVLALRFPRFAVPLLIVALIGGASRVIVGAHYPSDALAGLLFGAGFALITARWLARRNIAYRIPQIDAKLAFFPRRIIRFRHRGTSMGLHHDLWLAFKR